MKQKAVVLAVAVVAIVILSWFALRYLGPWQSAETSAEPAPTAPTGGEASESASTTPGVPASPPAASASPAPTPEAVAHPTLGATAPPVDPASAADPFSLISWESMLAFVADLAAIQPYSGWRNSGSSGEAEALGYVESELSELAFLAEIGMELEQQSFRVFMATELRDTRLELTLADQAALLEVPADGLRGPRDELPQALRFDSDGVLNDANPDPQVVEGPVVLMRSASELAAVGRGELKDKVVFLDYAAIDRIVLRSSEQAAEVASDLFSKEPAGLVLVTTFSNVPGESHGAFVGDLSALTWVETGDPVPTLYVRLEDLLPAGIKVWDDLKRVESARITWDADLFSPAESGNLVARIPGRDQSRAMILGAHIDSPNSPGALDDGSGSAILLETARVLDESHTLPPTDLYLVWFGSEELGLYGSSHFVATHQELLDRTQAMLQADMLSRPLDGIHAEISLVAWPYDGLGDLQPPWPAFLAGKAAEQGVKTAVEALGYPYSDNSSFDGFGVPNADLIYVNERAMEATGSLHYAAHIHDPYDTPALVQEMRETLEQMARVMLTAALSVPPDPAGWRVPPPPEHRALFVASHTEAVQMSPAGLTELGMALAMEGFDVDLIPYGQPVGPADLKGADLVVALPVVDYPSPESESTLYDESWRSAEIAALEAYVSDGGLLVLTNSAHRLKLGGRVLEVNEDWSDMNDLASLFGIAYLPGALKGDQATVQASHPLVEGVAALSLLEGNGVRMELASDSGRTGSSVLAQTSGEPSVALLDAGPGGGQVLVLSDLGLLAAGWGGPDQATFWRNLARYAAR